ncbi:MAG: hypothetical protein JSS19_08930 [Proteobacteria bacterium]|nr:hypothetical protein [Pseudomonadota bacterium]MBS0609462.1 hypothetical protein [Pseudomonadota bacterium]
MTSTAAIGPRRIILRLCKHWGHKFAQVVAEQVQRMARGETDIWDWQRRAGWGRQDM